jgi:type I restriction enzyme S subunit
MSWEVVQLGVFLKNRDLRFKPNDPKIKGLKRIEKIDFSGNIYLSDKPSNTDMILVKKGDLVISGINVEKGAMAVYQGENDITATIHYSSYEFDPAKIDLNFLKNFLKSEKFTEALKEQVPGGIKTEIKPKHILPLEVKIPNEIDEQKIIIKKFESKKVKLESIDIERTLQLDFLQKLRQKILQDAIQGKLIRQDHNDEPASKLLERIKSEKEALVREKKIKNEKIPLPIIPEDFPFEIPESWVWCRLGELCIDLTYGTSQKAEDYGDVPVLRMGNITSNGSIIYSNLKYVMKTISDLPKLFLESGDLVFNRTNSFELVGKCGVYDRKERFTLASYLIRVRFTTDTNSNYISSYINSKICRETQIEPDTIQQNGQANFNGTKLSKVLIPLPPLKEQNRIVLKIEQLMKLCDELEQSIHQNKKYTQDLLQLALKEALEPKSN